MARSFIQGVWLNLAPFDLSPGPSGHRLWLHAPSPCPPLQAVHLRVLTPAVPRSVVENQKDPRTRVLSHLPLTRWVTLSTAYHCSFLVSPWVIRPLWPEGPPSSSDLWSGRSGVRTLPAHQPPPSLLVFLGSTQALLPTASHPSQISPGSLSVSSETSSLWPPCLKPHFYPAV